MGIETSTLAFISLGLNAASTVAQVVAQRQERAAAKAQGEYDAAVARNNAILAERQAADVLARGKETATDIGRRGRIAEQLQRRETQQLIGVQRAALAGAGVEVDTGTAGDIATDTAGLGEFDVQVTRTETAANRRSALDNAERAAFEFRTRGTAFQAEAELAKARAFRPNTDLATVLSGGTTLASRFVQFRANRIID